MAQGSIASADLVTYILRKEKIDTIMHFAAQTHVDNSFGNSIAFTESNVLGAWAPNGAALAAARVRRLSRCCLLARLVRDMLGRPPALAAGTHVLLEAAKEAKVKLFVHVSTDEVYGDGISGVASHEGSVLEPTNPYS